MIFLKKFPLNELLCTRGIGEVRQRKPPLRGGQGRRGKGGGGDRGKYFLSDFLEIWNVYVESNSKNFLFVGIFRF